MRIAVTGATGFIGRHVVEEALRQGHEVVATGRSRKKVTGMPWISRVTFRELDLASPGADPFDHLGRPDGLVHLAWSGLESYNSMDHFTVELPRHFDFLGRMRTGGLHTMLVTGTCLEYGMQLGCLSESQPTAPGTPYGFAKDALRRQLEFLRTESPFALIWTRLFYVYGDCPGRRTLYTLLKEAAERGDASFPMSRGEQIRDYISVEDVARHLIQLVAKQADLGVVNMCSGAPISVRGRVEGWMAANGWKMTLELGRYPIPDYEPFAFWGDRARLDEIATAP